MKRLLPITLSLLALCVVPLLAAVTDAFTGSDGTALTSHNTSSSHPWETQEGTVLEIQSNKASPVSTGYSASTPSDAPFPNDQHAQVVVKPVDSNGNFMGPCVRATGNTWFYAEMLDAAAGGEVQIKKRIAGANTFIAGAAHGIADGTDATVDLVATGTGASGLEVFVNGVSKITGTAAAIASGKPGACGFWSSVGTKRVADDFVATDPTTSGALPPSLLLMGCCR